MWIHRPNHRILQIGDMIAWQHTRGMNIFCGVILRNATMEEGAHLPYESRKYYLVGNLSTMTNAIVGGRYILP